MAWNQIRMNELVSTKEDRDRLFAEIRVLKQLKHKNIMTFHDSWLEKQGYTVNFITELFTSGTLRQYVSNSSRLDWCKPTTLFVASGLGALRQGMS